MRYTTREDKTVAAWTLLSVIALMGVAMLPGAVVDDADCWVSLTYYMSTHGASDEEVALVGTVGVLNSAVWSCACLAAFGGPVGFIAAVGIGL
uniref:Uncharacterized protein n=1 Tax=Candidatus Methanogaster sp. ANME-2c ERB4 TaxID=2759911 RepID=A0A7G9Y2E6_9EURY|nr:hypothetical protein EHLBLFLE_00002 [Methanosarcinales archaeon ANME-2c ERB4]QNO42401.1 hypothetical protein LFOPHFOE_00041 [Methanosarcinales archaeon ANME-2c ERB4]